MLSILGDGRVKSDTASHNKSLAVGMSLTATLTCLVVIVAVFSFLYSVQQIVVVAQTPEASYLDAANSGKSGPIHIFLLQGKPYFDRSGVLHITGEVQNNFGFPVQSVQVTATLYGSQKNIVDRKSAYTYIDQLKSGGGRSGFSVIVPANVIKNSTGYSISVTSYTKSAAEAPLSLKPALLNLNINKGAKDLNGNYHLLGNVTNKGNNTATHVRVSTVFLNGTNKIIDAQGGFTTPMNLQSGQTAPFNFTVLSPNLNEIKTVAVNTQSQEYSMMVNNNNNNNNSTQGSSGLVVPLPPVAVFSSSPITNNSNNKKPSLLLEVEKNPLISGNKQTIRVKLSDSTSDQGIPGAKVKGIIMPVSGHPKEEFSGKTDKSGHISYSWIINKNSKPGSFNVKVHVSTTNVTGYNSTFKNTSFKLIDKDDNNNGKSNNNDNNDNNAKHSDHNTKKHSKHHENHGGGQKNKHSSHGHQNKHSKHHGSFFGNDKFFD